MKKVVVLAVFLASASVAQAGKVVSCKVERSIPDTVSFNTTLCAVVEFAYPDNVVKGSIESKKGIGGCPEVAMLMARTFPAIRAINVIFGYVDTTYQSSLGFTNQTSGAIFYDNLPKRFVLDHVGEVSGKTVSFQVDCLVKKK